MPPQSGRRRIRHHGGEFDFAGCLALDARHTLELVDAAALLGEFDVEVEQAARRHRGAELGVLDAHEDNELAGAGQFHRLDPEDPGGLRQRLDLEHAGHDRVTGEVTGEVRLVHRHIFHAGAFVFAEAIDDAVDHEEWVTVGENFEHLVDVEDAFAIGNADGGGDH